MKKTIKLAIALGFLLPSVVLAAGKDLKYLVGIVLEYVDIAVYLIISLAILLFVWNIYKYFISGSDDVTAKKEAGLYVMWSIIGFFVILSLWGLVNILKNTFNLDNNRPTGGLFGSFNFSGSNNNTTNNNATFTPLGGVSNNGSTNLGGVSNNGSTNLGGVSNNSPENLNPSEGMADIPANNP